MGDARSLGIFALGTVVGLFFGIPPAFALCAMGLPWLPYGLSIVATGLWVGLLLAYLVVCFIRGLPVATGRGKRRGQGPLWARSQDARSRAGKRQ